LVGGVRAGGVGVRSYLDAGVNRDKRGERVIGPGRLHGRITPTERGRLSWRPLLNHQIERALIRFRSNRADDSRRLLTCG